MVAQGLRIVYIRIYVRTVPDPFEPQNTAFVAPYSLSYRFLVNERHHTVYYHRLVTKPLSGVTLSKVEPVWYYSKDSRGEYFTAYVDANTTSIKRRFNALDGSFVNQAAGGAGKSFNQAFSADLGSGIFLGPLNSRPRLANAVSDGRLPQNVLGELRLLLKAEARTVRDWLWKEGERF